MQKVDKKHQRCSERSSDVLALVERENQRCELDHTARRSNSRVSGTGMSNRYGIGW